MGLSFDFRLRLMERSKYKIFHFFVFNDCHHLCVNIEPPVALWVKLKYKLVFLHLPCFESGLQRWNRRRSRVLILCFSLFTRAYHILENSNTF